MKGYLVALQRWFDTSAGEGPTGEAGADRIDWLRCIPFVLLHAAVLLVFFVGWSWTAVGLAVALYVIRMFSLTAFYHRYFSHRTFKTSRPAQFIFALAGSSCAQRGPLWWASLHRHHHRVSDRPEDPHSPKHHGFLWSHMGWFMARRNFATRVEHIRDFHRFPELRILDRFDILAPCLGALGVYAAGEVLAATAPGLGTNGAQLLVWSIVSTVVLFHCTSSINSLGHLFGRRRYETTDTSRNSFLLSLLALGEGWHNNHHHYQSSARLGHRRWEIDLAWYGLLALSRLGIIWNLQPVPDRLQHRPHPEPCQATSRFTSESRVVR